LIIGNVKKKIYQKLSKLFALSTCTHIHVVDMCRRSISFILAALLVIVFPVLTYMQIEREGERETATRRVKGKGGEEERVSHREGKGRVRGDRETITRRVKGKGMEGETVTRRVKVKGGERESIT
jgi:hypothetical protein